MSEYSDAKSQPHVAVALRMLELGKSEADLVNNFIPYVICKKEGQAKKMSLGECAYYPDEIK